MYYLSKGLLIEQDGSGSITVEHIGIQTQLDGRYARLWLAGSQSPERAEEEELRKLSKLDLIGYQDEGDYIQAVYRILIESVMLPRHPAPDIEIPDVPVMMLRWLREAGLHLTIAELVRIHELGLRPVTSLLGEANRQVLVEKIYSHDSIFDGELERRMATSKFLAEVIEAVLLLLHSGKIYIS